MMFIFLNGVSLTHVMHVDIFYAYYSMEIFKIFKKLGNNVSNYSIQFVVQIS